MRAGHMKQSRADERNKRSILCLQAQSRNIGFLCTPEMDVPIAGAKSDVNVEGIGERVVSGHTAHLIKPQYLPSLFGLLLRFIKVIRRDLPISVNQIWMYGKQDQPAL